MPSSAHRLDSPADERGRRTRLTVLLNRPIWWLWLILVMGAAVRTTNLNLPPVGYHSWRQTETAALARNYAEEGYRLFYPTVNWRGNTPGYVESELSLYAFTVALGYGLIGFDETIARLVSIAVTAACGYLIFLIGQRLWDTRSGLLAATAFTFFSPFSLFFGQAIMGDMTVIFLVTLVVYSGTRWYDSGSPAWFWLAVVTATLGALSKLPAVYIGVPLAIIIYQRQGWSMLRRWQNWLAALVALLAVAAWYFHAHRLGQDTGLTFGILGSTDKVGNIRLLMKPGFYYALIRNFSYRLLTSSGLLLWLAGMALARHNPLEKALYAWIMSTLTYFLFAASGVLHQDYYTLALLPPAALFIGKALGWIYGRVVAWSAMNSAAYRGVAWVMFGLWVVVLQRAGAEVIPSTQEMFAPLEPAVGTWATGQWVQAATPADAGLVVLGSSPPEGLYFSHRNGLWLREANELETAQQEGWPYAVILNPYYSGYQAVPQWHQRWRTIGGGKWFLAFDLQQAVPVFPDFTFAQLPQWGQQISLTGYDLRPYHLVNDKLYLVLHWRADQTPSTQYVGFIHAWNEDGIMCGQDDHQVLNGLFGSDRWQPGQQILDAYEVDVSACPASGQYLLNVGLYQADSGQRLTLSSWPSQDQLHTFDVDLSPVP